MVVLITAPQSGGEVPEIQNVSDIVYGDPLSLSISSRLPPSPTNDRIICLQGALFLHYPFCHGFTLLYSIGLSPSLVDKINGVGGATPVPDAVSYCVLQ